MEGGGGWWRIRDFILHTFLFIITLQITLFYNIYLFSGGLEDKYKMGGQTE